jgi:hypothetical protein
MSKRQDESHTSGLIRNALNARGHFVFKHWSGPYSPLGVSDIVGTSRDGIAIFLEVKRPGKEISGLAPEQRAFLARLIKVTNGRAIVAVVSTVEAAIKVVEAERAFSFIDARGLVTREEFFP